jgi:phosphatidate cytidylyltransferase
MLKQRIITAVLLLAVLVPAVFYPDPAVFALVAMGLIAAAAWEWARLNQYGPALAWVSGGICAAMCLASWGFGWVGGTPKLLWIGAGSAWVLMAAWLLRAGVPAWVKVPQALRWLGGLFALWVAWLAVVQARTMGVNFLFSVLFLVWVADVFAYFAGRTLGGRFFARKLAPSISPGKTWEGVCGGLTGVVLMAFAWRAWDQTGAVAHPSLYTLIGVHGTAFLALAAFFLTMMSVVGDLVESLFKRSAGVKDSSNLLPGHGGVLDRVDALLPILPLAMVFATL